MLSIPAIQSFFIILIGYLLHTCFLQFYFYLLSAKNITKWKIQPKSYPDHVGIFWGPPLISSKPHRGDYHRIFTTLNLLVASCAAAFTAECVVRQVTKMYFDPIDSYYAVLQILWEVLIAVTYESVAEYYWHRLMHTKFCYARFHKFHHFYKSPEPWDDMYIHPLEALGYYCILYAPPFLFSIHQYTFFVYMVIMGICGVLDHSGIRFEVPGVYDTIDHDNHHAKFEINYSFPFPYMDILHGTYEGVFLGRQYTRNKRAL